MTLRLPASLLARQTPAVRALLAKAQAKGAVVTTEVRREGDVVTIVLAGLRLVNPLNNRQHYLTVWRRGKAEGDAVAVALLDEQAPPLPANVTIIRVGRGTMDSDGCIASAKHVRDSVALWLGCDDADPRVTFVVEQERGEPSVKIVVTHVEC